MIASLSLGGIPTASAAEVDATQIQTSNTNTLIKNEKTQLKSEYISKNSTNTQKSVDKSIKTVEKIDEKKQLTTQNKNMVKYRETESPKSLTIVRKSKKVVKTNDVSSSTVKQENINKATVSNNTQNTVKTTPNINEVEVTEDNASVTKETNNTTQTQVQPKTSNTTINTSSSSTTINIPVINQNTENSQNVDSEASVSNTTNNQSTDTITNNNQEYMAAGENLNTTFTVNQVIDAASRVKKFIDTKKVLPNYVTINGINVNMASFLELITTATLNINNKDLTSVIYLYDCVKGPIPRDEIGSGYMPEAEYLKIASIVKTSMDKGGVAPEFYENTSLGRFFGYENMIYTFSSILSSYKTNNTLPSSVAVQKWYNTQVPNELLPYTQSSANCQSNDARIKALATSITQNYSTTYDKATAIFNWVRDNLSYSFYYNTKYGAVGALNARTGNCVDTAHLLIALERAAGIPAKYVHGTCQFSSGSWYGHVWAQVWVDGKWYTADATSNYNTFGVINNWNTATYTLKGTYISLPF